MLENVKIVVFGSSWDVESPSPFCLKLVAWLEMAGVDYQLEYPKGAPKSKTGKAPYLILEDGTIVEDSQRAIEFLEKENVLDLDAHLSEREKIQSLALRRLFEDHLYFDLVYDRWVQHWDEIRHPYFDALPPIVRTIAPTMIRRGVVKALHGQGTGRRSTREVIKEGKADLDAISKWLGESDYFFEQASSIDAVAFGFLENMINVPLKTELTDYASSKENLVAFCSRFRTRFFDDSLKS